MKRMSLILGSLFSSAFLVGMCAPGLAAPAVEDQTQIKVGGRFEEVGFAEALQSDPGRNANRVYLFMTRNRLDVTATRGDYKFYSQLTLGGEDPNSNTNVNLTLTDMYGQGKLFGGMATWRVGQFKVPTGREEMTEPGNLSFNDYSIMNSWFQSGRDYGAAWNTDFGMANATLGVFSGGGRDLPQRYLPQVLGIPELVLRVGVGNLDPDPFQSNQHAFDLKDMRLGGNATVLFTRDSLVGHSNALGVRNVVDKNNFLSGNYNPWISKKDPATGEPTQGQYWLGSLDGGLKMPLMDGVLSADAECEYQSFANPLPGSLISMTGLMARAGYYMNPCEVAVRYAVVYPDAGMSVVSSTGANSGKSYAIFPDAKPIQEITPAFTWFINGENLKLTLDMPILLDAPIVTEYVKPGEPLGNYNLVNQPDQTPLLAALPIGRTSPINSIARQFVFQIRGGLQYAF